MFVHSEVEEKVKEGNRAFVGQGPPRRPPTQTPISQQSSSRQHLTHTITFFGNSFPTRRHYKDLINGVQSSRSPRLLGNMQKTADRQVGAGKFIHRWKSPHTQTFEPCLSEYFIAINVRNNPSRLDMHLCRLLSYAPLCPFILPYASAVSSLADGVQIRA